MHTAVELVIGVAQLRFGEFSLGDVEDDRGKNSDLIDVHVLQVYFHRIARTVLAGMHSLENQYVIPMSQRLNQRLERGSIELGLDVEGRHLGKFRHCIAEIIFRPLIDVQKFQRFRIEHINLVERPLEYLPKELGRPSRQERRLFEFAEKLVHEALIGLVFLR